MGSPSQCQTPFLRCKVLLNTAHPVCVEQQDIVLLYHSIGAESQQSRVLLFEGCFLLFFLMHKKKGWISWSLLSKHLAAWLCLMMRGKKIFCFGGECCLPTEFEKKNASFYHREPHCLIGKTLQRGFASVGSRYQPLPEVKQETGGIQNVGFLGGEGNIPWLPSSTYQEYRRISTISLLSSSRPTPSWGLLAVSFSSSSSIRRGLSFINISLF